MAAKRKTSAKQRAAARKNVKKARAAKKKKKTGTRSSKKAKTSRKSGKTSPRKTNKPKSPRKNVVGKGKIPLIDNPTVKKAAIGVGFGTLAGVVIGLISPNLGANPLVRAGAGFLGGGPIGAIASLLIGGGLGNLGNLFGGQGGQASGAGAA